MTEARRFGPRALVAATFAGLTAGFLAAAWLIPGSEPAGETAGAPHSIGAQENIQLGMRALAAGDPIEAERLFRQAAVLRPTEPAPHANVAVALMAQERWGEASGAIDRARRYGPESPEVYFLEGLLARVGLEDTTRARAAWERFLALVPSDAPQAVAVRRWLSEMAAGGESPPGLGELLEEPITPPGGG